MFYHQLCVAQGSSRSSGQAERNCHHGSTSSCNTIVFIDNSVAHCCSDKEPPCCLTFSALTLCLDFFFTPTRLPLPHRTPHHWLSVNSISLFLPNMALLCGFTSISRRTNPLISGKWGAPLVRCCSPWWGARRGATTRIAGGFRP